MWASSGERAHHATTGAMGAGILTVAPEAAPHMRGVESSDADTICRPSLVTVQSATGPSCDR